MSWALELKSLSPKLQYHLNDTLKVFQRYGRRKEFKKEFRLCHLDGDQEYLLVPLACRAKYVEGQNTLVPHTHDYSETPSLRPNSEFVYPKIKPGVLEGFKLRDNQVSIVESALEALNRYSTTLMDLSCSYGKTLLSMYVAIELGYKFIFVTPRNNLKAQTYNDAGKLCPSKIQIIKTKVKIDPDVQGYIISSHILKNYTQDDFPGVATMILDELQMIFTPSFIPSLFNFQPMYLIALSATPYRKDGLGDAFPLFIDPRSHVKGEIIRPLHLFKVTTVLKPPVEYNFDKSLNWDLVEVAQRDCYWRHVGIATLALKYIDKKVIIACKRVPHVLSIIQILESWGIRVARMMEKDETYDKTAPILVGIVNKMGVGMDGDHNVIILAASIKAGTKPEDQVAIHQLVKRVGRKEGSEPIVIDIVDNNTTLQSHFSSRLPWYEKQIILSRRDFVMKPNIIVEINSPKV